MKQYLDLNERIIDEGVWVSNKRTNTRCLTVIDASLTYEVGKNEFPLITTRKSYWKAAIAEMLGYIRGYTNAADFRALGAKTWDANANMNKEWVNNPNREGKDHMGTVYGAVGNAWPVTSGVVGNLADDKPIDLLEKCYTNLKQGIDDRGETWTFWNPGMFHLGCLRPCLHSHTFSILGDTLHLTSFQRSADVPLGLNFNGVQVFTLLALMAQITGLKAGTVYHKIVNAHIYEPQLEQMRDIQLLRKPYPSPQLKINPNIRTLEDLRNCTVDDFEVIGYRHHEPISYPFTV